uniref:G-protein coupled receptors family 1 profile domain-containing protein n=1 Tax=Ascaris lumbricoides TaxID=6252 RepID=A0A9J2PZ89_ASCLU
MSYGINTTWKGYREGTTYFDASNFAAEDYQEYADEQDLLANDPTVRTVAAVTLTDGERYRSGTGVALCSMAAADLCSLLLILAQNIMQITPQIDSDTIFMSVVCKLMLFCTHTVTGISIWSWLLLSTMRYLAVRHPLFHLRIWRMPYRALAFIVLMSLALNAWLLIAVHSTVFGCTQEALFNSLTFNRMFHIVESVWSFCVPFAMIIFMDASVVLKSTSCPNIFLRTKKKKKALEKLVIMSVRSTSLHIKQRPTRSLWRWLAIALICIILNTPENLYRLVMLFGMPDVHEEALHFAARMLAQALYFSQFAFNAVYLALFVFDKSTRPKGCVEASVNGSSVYFSAFKPQRNRFQSTSSNEQPSHTSI